MLCLLRRGRSTLRRGIFVKDAIAQRAKGEREFLKFKAFSHMHTRCCCCFESERTPPASLVDTVYSQLFRATLNFSLSLRRRRWTLSVTAPHSAPHHRRGEVGGISHPNYMADNIRQTTRYRSRGRGGGSCRSPPSNCSCSCRCRRRRRSR